jgi:coenzyme F420-dependent glucose-6-phosphate dehydrogenase
MPTAEERPRKELGYWLSSEEHPATRLVEMAVHAEDAGFTRAMISDHFHPWVRRQGHSPFVWSVLGAIANATERLRVGTGVTAPIHRIHPVVLAQAAATTAALFGDRFSLGLGSGERLNENVTGQRWPSAGERREMLEEAIDIIRRLWAGKAVNHRGRHFQVHNAQLFTLPAAPPDLLVAGGGRRTIELAGRASDGLISVEPDERIIEMFDTAGGHAKRKIGQVKVCFAPTEAEARATALEWWPNGALKGGPLAELARPEDFEAATEHVTEDHLASAIVCGPDPARHVRAVRAFYAAGYHEVYVHQVGPHQQPFLDFYRSEVVPELFGAGL